MADREKLLGEVRLTDVRLSFPSLFKPKASISDGPVKYRAAFLMDPKTNSGKTNIRACQAVIKEVEKEVWGEARAAKGISYKEGRNRLSKGNAKTSQRTGEVYDGYKDMWVVDATNDRRPTLLNRNKEQITEDNGVLYAGCYVDAIVRFYGIKDEKKGGTGMFASLEAVRFRRQGAAFGAAPVGEEAFEDLDDEEESGEFDDAAEAPPPPARTAAAAKGTKAAAKPAARPAPSDDDDLLGDATDGDLPF